MFRAVEPGPEGRERLVAVKVFRLDFTPEQATKLAAALQSVVDAGLNHPTLAAPIAAGLEFGVPFLAQEYAVGESLDVVLRQHGPLPIAEVVSMVDRLASAVDHAAGKGIQHGALHPRDIVVSPDGVRVTGFGIAKALQAVGAKSPTRPQYSDPDAASDVYALAAIAFEAASGRRASADHLAAFAHEHGSALGDAFRTVLASEGERRLRRAADFARALAVAAGAATGGAPAAIGPFVSEAAHEEDVDLPPFATETPQPVVDVSQPVERSVRFPPEPADPLDPYVDLGAKAGGPVQSDARPWTTDPLRAFREPEIERERSRRARWEIIGVFLLFAFATALSVAYFLRSPAPVAVEEREESGGTTVDLQPVAPPEPQPPVSPPAGSAPPQRGSPAPPKGAPAPSQPPPAGRRNSAAPQVSPQPPARESARGGATPARGSLLIRSTPGDADVSVNGRASGRTPLVLRDLAFGSYNIRVERQGYAAEERRLLVTAERPAESTTVELRRPGTPAVGAATGDLSVQSRPAGARVFVNNQPAGSTPLTLTAIAAGSATVRIEMDGYLPWVATVVVNAGQQARVAASLERAQSR